MSDPNGSAPGDGASDPGEGGLSDIALEALEGEAPSIDTTGTPSRDERGKFKASGEPAHDDKPAQRNWKLKVNDKEYVVDSEEKLIAQAQRGLAVQQHWEKVRGEVETMRSQLQRQLAEAEQAKKDPAGWLKRLDPQRMEDIAEQLLLERAQEALALEKMTPRERELYREKKAYQEKLKAHEEEQKTAQAKQEEQAVEEQKNQLGALFTKTLAEHKLPANQTTVRVMAAIYRAGLAKGVDLQPAHLAEVTRQQLKQISDASYAAMKPEEFVAAYPQLADGIRKHFLTLAKEKQKAGEPHNVHAKPGTVVRAADVPDKSQDWDRYIEKLKREGSSLRVKNGWG